MTKEPLHIEKAESGAELLFDDAVFQIMLYREQATLELVFNETPERDKFRNAYQLAIDAALRKDAKYWLTDARNIKAMLPENQVWLAQQMGSLLSTYRIQKFAIVMAPECYVMTNPSKVYDKAAPAENENKGVIKIHFSKESAFSWFTGGELN